MLLGLVIILAISFTVVNQTFVNSTDGCPRSYYGNGHLLDLLDRGWCRD